MCAVGTIFGHQSVVSSAAMDPVARDEPPLIRSAFRGGRGLARGTRPVLTAWSRTSGSYRFANRKNQAPPATVNLLHEEAALIRAIEPRAQLSRRRSRVRDPSGASQQPPPCTAGCTVARSPGGFGVGSTSEPTWNCGVTAYC